MTARRIHSVEDFLTFPRTIGLAFHSQGTEIYYSSDASGIYNVVRLPVGGEPEQITFSSEESIELVSLFPDDSRLLVTYDSGGNEHYGLYVWDSGKLTPALQNRGSRDLFLDWSADGRSFFILSNQRGPSCQDLVEVSCDDFEGRTLFLNDGEFMSMSLSPDKRWLAMSRFEDRQTRSLWLCDLASQEKQVVIHESGVEASAVAWAPDSKSLYAITNSGSDLHYCARYFRESKTWERLPLGDGAIERVWLSPCGGLLAFASDREGLTHLDVFDLKQGHCLGLDALELDGVGSVRFSRDASRLAFRCSNPTVPSGLGVLNLADGHVRILTNHRPSGIPMEDFSSVEHLWFSSFDGLAIPAVLYRPAWQTTERLPALVWVHGGPGGQSRRDYSGPLQFLANQGFVCLAVNNRGSSGYGKTFNGLDRRRHGQDDLDDCVWGAKFLQGRSDVDGNNIAIAGNSYGGFMALAALAFRPQAFAAGVDIYGLSNWVRTMSSMPAWWGRMRDVLWDYLGHPERDRAYLESISPLFHATNIQRPLLVVQGANDPRALKVESEEIVAAVRANAVPVEYVLFPDEGHGFMKRENNIRAWKSVAEFLAEHLGREAASKA